MLKRALIISAIASLTALASTANASMPGFYAGGQLGYGNTNYSKGDANATSIDKSRLAGRLFGGYQFNPSFAAELGYTKFSDTKFKNINNIPGSKFTLKQQAIDLVGKGILPLDNKFSAYGVLGGAYLMADGKASVDGESAKGDENKLFPTFGVGLSYDITPNVPVDISWRRIQKTGGTDLKSADFYSVGIAYNFG